MPPDITLSQLRAIVAICDNDLNVTAAAAQLGIAQPSLSKKLSALEQTIGKPLFYRNGKRLQYQTEHGRQIATLARQILIKCDNLIQIARTSADPHLAGELAIGTTHTQARYVLPPVLAAFRRDYPNIAINIRQGAPADLVRLLASAHLDVVICTEALETNASFRTMTSFTWNRALITPSDHPMATADLTLENIAAHPLVTYTRGFTGRAACDTAFTQAGITPRIAVAATDADTIKTYVRLGFGIGIIAQMACDPTEKDLVTRPLAHLFPDMQVRLAYLREKHTTPAMQRFIQLFHQAPLLSSQTQKET